MIVGSHGTFCTGVAIARDLVLTAGHCIETNTDYKLVEFDASHHPRLLDVHDIARHPQFNLKSLFAHRATADLALLKMAQPLPNDIIPASLGKDVVPKVGETLTIFGYGLAIPGNGKTGGTLRAASLIVTGRPGNLQIRLVDPKTGGTTPGLGGCTGDSGAPVFAGTVLDRRGELVDRSELGCGLRRNDRRHADRALPWLDLGHCPQAGIAIAAVTLQRAEIMHGQGMLSQQC